MVTSYLKEVVAVRVSDSYKMLFDLRILQRRIEGRRLKKSRYHEAKHNAVYDMTTKAYKSRVMA